jgi:uncharacterized protein YbgA (DUF1722 family)/uncharacterized protein YbbK (DUF523 family)
MGSESSKPVLGISACLLGQEVRYNGGHKRDAFVTRILSEFVDYLPICPEVEIGMGVPRPPIRLVGDPAHPRAVGVADPSLDVTARLQRYASSRCADLAHLSGYILKKDSPSCGMERVKVYSDRTPGPGARNGTGLFARALMDRLPALPVEEEGRLHDPVLRENFVNRVFVLRRWQDLVDRGITAAGLIDFHTTHKFLVMAHSQAAYQRLGRMLAQLAGKNLRTVGNAYIGELLTALRRRVSRARHVNVLQHIMGYLKRDIDATDKQELLANLEAYRRGELPLVVPVTLLRDYLRRHPDPYMARQVYLAPAPPKMGLRNAL